MTAAPRLRPWQVWLADLGVPAGHEQGGVRPVIVVGSEVHCRFPIGMALVVPLTSRDRGLAHHVAVHSPESGLKQPSWARTEDIRAISVDRLVRGTPLGTLTEPEITDLTDWLREMVAFA